MMSLTTFFIGLKGTLYRLKYRVFMIMARRLLFKAYFIILKIEETSTKSDRSKEV